MEQTLHALAGILLKAIPTIILVLLLHFYLKSMLFKPLEKVLKQRDDATAGARKSAEESVQLAEKKAAEFDEAIAAARADVYREQESQRKKWLEQEEAQIRDARTRADQAIAAAKAEIDEEVQAARQSLADATSGLADDISRQVLEGAGKVSA